MLAESHFYFHKAAEILGVPDKVQTILLTPRRSVKVEIVTVLIDSTRPYYLWPNNLE